MTFSPPQENGKDEAPLNAPPRQDAPRQDAPPSPPPSEPSSEEKSQELSAWRLRVLTGRQAGAETALEATRYKIGSDPECDIVLSAEGVAPLHLEIFFADGSLSILRIHAPIEREEGAIEDTPWDLPEMTALKVGACWIAYGETAGEAGEAGAAGRLDAEAWPSAADLLSSEEMEEQEAGFSDEAASLQKEGEAKEGGGASARRGLFGSDKEARRAMEMPIFQTARRMASAIAPLLLLVMGGLLILGALETTWRAGPGEMAKSAPLSPSPADRLRQTLREDPAFATVRLAHDNRDGAPFLLGYVEKTADLNRLRSLAGSLGARLRVDSLEHFRQSLQALLPLYGSHLSYDVRSDMEKGARARVQGLLNDRGRVLSLKEAIRRDLPGLAEVYTNVLTLEEAKRHLKEMVAHHKVFETLSIRQEGRKLIVSGDILENFRPVWETVSRELSHAMPAGLVPELRVRVGPSFTPEIRSLLITPGSRRLRLIHADRSSRAYKEGALLPQGFTLKAIRADALLLGKGEGEYLYPLSQD